VAAVAVAAWAAWDRSATEPGGRLKGGRRMGEREE
jgi:hypothetical protein